MTHTSRLEALTDLVLSEERFSGPGLHSPLPEVFEPKRWESQPKVQATVKGIHDLRL